MSDNLSRVGKTIEVMKRCPKCWQIKSTSEFYKNKSKKDGLTSHCKSCHKNSVNNYRKTEKGKEVHRKTVRNYLQTEKGKITKKRYAQSEKGKVAHRYYQQSEKGKTNQKRFKIRHPERRKATSAVNNAIAAGKLPRPDTMLCSYCPKPAQQYHHWLGYAPEYCLNVTPVCQECHTKFHRRIA